jgi:hypothetical protein
MTEISRSALQGCVNSTKIRPSAIRRDRSTSWAEVPARFSVEAEDGDAQMTFARMRMDHSGNGDVSTLCASDRPANMTLPFGRSRSQGQVHSGYDKRHPRPTGRAESPWDILTVAFDDTE